MDAINAPIRRRKYAESTNFDMGQKPDIDMGLDKEPKVPPIESIHAEALNDGNLEALKFNEEPVEVMVYPSSEENAPKAIECWVNGKGAELFNDGKWHTIGAIPVGFNVITRRKYAEVLLKARRDKITTSHDGTEVERPNNRVIRGSSAVANIQIVTDNNPRGMEWLRRCMAQAG